ncbi:hypothetical protein [Microbacterium sp. SLBN-146]|uniref:hypothetical protein n=1 Tax=Microbacterium sp. SLBN-146 TaxID=2768457 RepID=UPI00116D4BBF|nr:hypothetical protein [Microbacterium sp. SLBN-146]TQJ31946.1 hypothetical protein FBY39_2435 [Microbacterium sp. SLBN-146]
MALSVDINANARGAQSQVKDLGKALEGVSDALDDLAAEADTSGGRVERSFREMTKDAESAEKANERLAKSGKKVGDDAGSGFRKAGDASSEFKDEALSNLSEVTSSFDGSMESVGDLVQGTLGGVSANLGLIGLAAAPAAAAVGVITDTFVKAKEASDEARDSAYEYGITVAESGKYADAAARIGELTGSVEELRKIQEIATVSGWRQKDVLTALATGDGMPALTAAFNEGANTTTVTVGRLQELQGTLDGTALGFSLSKDAARLNANALYDLATTAGEATGEVDDLGNAIVTMPGGKQVVIDAKTKTAHEDIDALEQRQLPQKTQPVKVVVDRSEWDNWRPTVKNGEVKAKPAVGRYWE